MRTMHQLLRMDGEEDAHGGERNRLRINDGRSNDRDNEGEKKWGMNEGIMEEMKEGL